MGKHRTCLAESGNETFADPSGEIESSPVCSDSVLVRGLFFFELSPVCSGSVLSEWPFFLFWFSESSPVCSDSVLPNIVFLSPSWRRIRATHWQRLFREGDDASK